MCLLIRPIDTGAEISETYISAEAYECCERYGKEYGIQPELLMAIIETESSGNPNAINGSCKGLMQINDKFHTERLKTLRIENIYSTNGNIHAGADYLAELFSEYGEATYVLDKYNGNSDADFNQKNGIISQYAMTVLCRSRELELLHYGE